ncbi:MAG: ABC transporter ATP-binding protein [Rhizobiaceae bacterium]|nr:ABC transporter ATP-binding protein [Rhizobiaceae bacterium]
MASSLRLENITKTFGSVTVIDDVTIDIEPGRFVTLVGPSGCGKSTLLNMTASLERPTDGRILIDGRDVTMMTARQRGIAMVFQSYALYPHLTVRQNLAFPLRVQKVAKPEITKKVLQAADLMEIGHLLDRKPRELSGGQRQRVAISRAIIRPATVCLLDEPLSNLDAALRVRVRGELKLLFSRMETTTMFVTHDQSEAMTMSDSIVVLKDGKVQQQGTPLEVYRNPANEFVATFIGSPQMNVLDARIERTDEVVVHAGSIRLPLPESTLLPSGRVRLGIRPEFITAAPVSDGTPVTAKIELVEHMGNSAIVHYRFADGTSLIGLEMIDTQIGVGWEGAVYIDTQRLKFFDTATGQAI